jgi:hypothetical protein
MVMTPWPGRQIAPQGMEWMIHRLCVDKKAQKMRDIDRLNGSLMACRAGETRAHD